MAEFLVPDERIESHRAKWRWRGDARPEFADAPGPGQESVWDYPRPPRIVPDTRVVEVRSRERLIARTNRAVRVLETAGLPTVYLPPEDVRADLLIASGERSLCEWKGEAIDYDLVDGPRSVAWSYPRVFPEFAAIAGWFAFYPARVDCLFGGEPVRPQPGGYYGGWWTNEIVGPIKGEPGVADD